jgi:gentisate 1,2-dioxygenase
MTLEDRIRAAHCIPTWTDAPKIVGAAPNVGYQPYRWEWETARRLLAEAGEAITPERGAERRSIDHVNPTLAGGLSTTHAIGSAFQLVRPGEIAPAHRHAAAAIRFVFDGGADSIYTTVNGERLAMNRGDLLTTPSGCWHDHRNESDHDIVWFDALDYPLVNYLRAAWFEQHPDDAQKVDVPDGHSIRYGGPIRPDEPYRHGTPVMRYAGVAVTAALDQAACHAPDPHHGWRLRYVNPFSQDSTLPTFDCLAQRFPAGFRGEAWRSTASQVQLVVAGEGETEVDGERFAWHRGDVLSIPPWSWTALRVSSPVPAQLFTVTERPLLVTLNLYREEFTT